MAFQQMEENGSQEYYEEEEEDLDEDGQPKPTPEMIRNIINSIPSFQYNEEKKEEETGKSSRSSTKSIKHPEAKVTCSICLDGCRPNQQVKALQCSHIFHSKCIDKWLKQKLKCPSCRHRVEL